MISLCLVLAVLLTGCFSTPKKIESLAIGMPRWRVIQIMGEPFSTTQMFGRETLEYHLWEDLDTPNARRETFQVTIVDGKVARYGPVKPWEPVMWGSQAD